MTVPRSTTPDVGLLVVPFILTPVTVPVLEVFPFQFVISELVIPAAALALNTGSVSVVNVPVFLVKPHPLTVDSVTSAGIVAVILAIPLDTVALVLLNLTPVKVPVLSTPVHPDGVVTVISVPSTVAIVALDPAAAKEADLLST